MDRTLQEIYAEHHKRGNRYGFSFEMEERAAIISRWIGSGKKILDVGCRDGAFTQRIGHGNQVVGTDIDWTALQKCRNRLDIDVICHNVNTPLPFSDQSFDAVIMGEVLEHTFFPQRVIAESARVLKKRGCLIGSVPNAFRLKNRLLFLFGKRFDPDPTHLQQFSRDHLERLLRERFPVVFFRFFFGRYASLSPRLFGNTIIFFCQK